MVIMETPANRWFLGFVCADLAKKKGSLTPFDKYQVYPSPHEPQFALAVAVAAAFFSDD
jgi:hypothetical protein